MLDPCVFVLSTGRVGTQTLAALAYLARTVLAYHEPHPLLYGLSQQAYLQKSSLAIKQILTEAFIAVRQDLLMYSLHCELGYVETSPQVTFLGPLINQLLPHARFIHLIRNPGDFIRSGMRRNWYSGSPHDRTRIYPRMDTDCYAKWPALTPFQKNVWLWTETNRWVADFGKTVSPERWLCIRSEDLFSGNFDTLERFFAFLVQEIPSEKKVRRILGQQLNKQKIGEFPLPAEWSKEMISQFRELAGDMPQRLGYSSNNIA